MATTEERLAALEAKMAQLTATTPTTYYTHQYSGEEIDAAVGRAVTGGALDTSVTNVSNQLGTFVRPNLLDNWYFGKPVNQRGKTEQYGGGYFIDRWTASEGKFALTNNGLTLCVDGVNSWLSQWLDVDVEGQIITVSALTADGKLYTSTGQLTKQSDVRVSFDGGGYVSCGYISEISMFRFTLARYDTTLPITIRAVKLELGSTQTLAHREGDKWVLNEVPDYGEQLRRCQMYFWRFSPPQYVGCAIAFGLDKNTARAMIYLPEQMRTSPTLNLNASAGLFLSGASGDIFDMTVSGVWTAENAVCVDFKKDGAFEVNAPYFVRGGRSAYIDISADL